MIDDLMYLRNAMMKKIIETPVDKHHANLLMSLAYLRGKHMTK